MLDGLLESLKEIIHNGQSTFKFMMFYQIIVSHNYFDYLVLAAVLSITVILNT